MTGPVTRGAAIALTALLAGCFKPAENLPRGEAAYAVIPPADPTGSREAYRIGVLDTLSIRVFQEPDLSFNTLQVDAAGDINFPLVGQLNVAGMTPIELSRRLADGLGQRFIRSPQVVVGVVESAAQRVTVEGNVNRPGVYEISGASTLLEAVARAEGLTRVAVVDEVVVLRTINGERAGAVFNLQDIREGRVADPEILGGDKIVVGFSALKGVYRDFMAAGPLFNIFRLF